MRFARFEIGSGFFGSRSKILHGGIDRMRPMIPHWTSQAQSEHCHMWMVTKSEAVEMYARFFGTRHGRSAGNLARKTASSLETRGDLDGHRMWNEVADIRYN
jgi:hypothetical protein